MCLYILYIYILYSYININIFIKWTLWKLNGNANRIYICIRYENAIQLNRVKFKHHNLKGKFCAPLFSQESLDWLLWQLITEATRWTTVALNWSCSQNWQYWPSVSLWTRFCHHPVIGAIPLILMFLYCWNLQDYITQVRFLTIFWISVETPS